nr:MAG TPA: hypothetical protein [Caudoviricetes sp.]
MLSIFPTLISTHMPGNCESKYPPTQKHFSIFVWILLMYFTGRVICKY